MVKRIRESSRMSFVKLTLVNRGKESDWMVREDCSYEKKLKRIAELWGNGWFGVAVWFAIE